MALHRYNLDHKDLDSRGDLFVCLAFDDVTNETYIRDAHERMFGAGDDITKIPLADYLKTGEFAATVRKLIGDTPLDKSLGRNLLKKGVFKA